MADWEQLICASCFAHISNGGLQMKLFIISGLFSFIIFFWWRLHFPLSHIKKLRISPKHNKLDRVYWFNFAPQRLAVRSGTNGPTHYHLYANAFSHFHSNRCFSFSAKETFGHFVGIMPSGTLQEVEFWYRQEFLSVLLGFIPLIL